MGLLGGDGPDLAQLIIGDQDSFKAAIQESVAGGGAGAGRAAAGMQIPAAAMPKEAHPMTIAANAAVLQTLPFDDTQDFVREPKQSVRAAAGNRVGGARARAPPPTHRRKHSWLTAQLAAAAY